jgi:iron(II)-dependent oxidoreductase
VWVTREQARAYAAWAGGRLLTDTEWARACQGNVGRAYPWGEAAPDAKRANFGGNVDDTTAVGSWRGPARMAR